MTKIASSVLLIMFVSSAALAGAWTNPVTPTKCLAGYTDGKIFVYGFEES